MDRYISKFGQLLGSLMWSFREEFDLPDNPPEVMEALVNFLAWTQYTEETPEDTDLIWDDQENGIDGAFIFVDDVPATTLDDLKNLLTTGKKKKQVTIVFTQAKSGTTWQKDGISVFDQAVRDWLDASPSMNWSSRHKDLQQMVKHVWSDPLNVEGGRPAIAAYFGCATRNPASRDISGSGDAMRKNLQAMSLFKSVSVDLWNGDDLYDLRTSAADPIQVTAPLVDYSSFKAIPGVDSAHIALMRASDFVNEILTDGSGKLRKSIFDENVRDFLGEEEEVNREIAATLSNNKIRGQFGLLNNGITLVSSDVNVLSHQLHMSDFQIVNGCQTSNVLFENREELTDDVCVVLKIVETSDPDVSAAVVRSTNRQSAVDPTQFMAISKSSRRIEEYFLLRAKRENPPLYYARRTGQYRTDSDAKGNRTFDFRKIARCAAAMFFEIPHTAKRYPNTLFKVDDQAESQAAASRTTTNSVSENVKVAEPVAAMIFKEEVRPEIFYTAALAYNRLNSVLSNNDKFKKYKRASYHLMGGIRVYLDGKNTQPTSDRIIDVCKRIEHFCNNLTGECEDKFLQICEALGDIEQVSDDRLKRSQFTAEYFDHVKKLRNKPRK